MKLLHVGNGPTLYFPLNVCFPSGRDYLHDIYNPCIEYIKFTEILQPAKAHSHLLLYQSNAFYVVGGSKTSECSA